MKKLLLAVCGSLMAFVSFAYEIKANEVFGYSLTTDIVYGTGKVTKDGAVVERDLLMDVYTPAGITTNEKFPAVILVHGGAFHRGGLRLPPYREDGAVHSAMQDWARLLTPLGYVCFVIEYRLTPELPVPDMKIGAEGLQPLNEAVTPSGLARTNFARKSMGLTGVSYDDRYILFNGVIAAAEDLNKAVVNIQKSAEEYGVDPDRIAIGGHSAGATTVLNTAYGIRSPVKAAFPLSPAVTGFDFKKTINSPDLPALLIVQSQFDVAAILEGVPQVVSIAKNAGLEYNLAWIPGFGHFYPTGAVSLGDDGVRMSIGERVIQFLDKHLKR